jgi:ubiquinone/menaquinone biosynthesis C-methylase UbiE
VREAHRILKPGGQFIVANLSPMVTAGNRWLRDASGEKICYVLDNYFDESPRSFEMCGGTINNTHHTLTRYISTFLAAGFTLEKLEEPYPSKQQLEQCPDVADNLRSPLFIIYQLRKPAAPR